MKGPSRFPEPSVRSQGKDSTTRWRFGEDDGRGDTMEDLDGFCTEIGEEVCEDDEGGDPLTALMAEAAPSISQSRCPSVTSAAAAARSSISSVTAARAPSASAAADREAVPAATHAQDAVSKNSSTSIATPELSLQVEVSGSSSLTPLTTQYTSASRTPQPVPTAVPLHSPSSPNLYPASSPLKRAPSQPAIQGAAADLFVSRSNPSPRAHSRTPGSPATPRAHGVSQTKQHVEAPNAVEADDGLSDGSPNGQKQKKKVVASYEATTVKPGRGPRSLLCKQLSRSAAVYIFISR